MTWAKLDDQIHGDPRVFRAGLEAFGLFCVALSWMGAHLTDGEIGLVEVRRLAGRKGERLAGRLVEAGLWDEITPSQWRVRSWDNFLLARTYVEADRARKSELGRAGARAKHAKPVDSGLPYGNGVSGGSRASDPVPSRPVPSRPVPSPERSEDPPFPPKGADAFKLEPTEPDPKPARGRKPGPAKASKPRTPAVPVLTLEDLSMLERDAAKAIQRDVSLSLVCKNVLQLARDLVAAAPRVAVAAEIPKAGAWARANNAPLLKPNAFLVNWINKAEKDAAVAGRAPIRDPYDGFPKGPPPELPPFDPGPIDPNQKLMSGDEIMAMCEGIAAKWDRPGSRA